MITDYKIHTANTKLAENVGKFYVKDNIFIIYYFTNYSKLASIFYVSSIYCTFIDSTPNTYLEEHSEMIQVDDVLKIEFLTVEELFKIARTEVLNLYRMLVNLPENDLYHNGKKELFITEFGKIDDEEMNEITAKIEAEKYNL